MVGTLGDLDGRVEGNGPCRHDAEPYRERRRKFPRGRRDKDRYAPTEGRGMEMPVRPVGLDPIVAEIIEALARTIIRDEDGRTSLPLTNKNE